MHVFQAFAPFVPEASRSIREVGAFVRDALMGTPAITRAAA
jgi:hypothetical protein